MTVLPPPVLQEAVSTRDLELVQLVLRYRDYQRVVKRLAGIPVLLEKLRKVRAASPPSPRTLSSTGLGALLLPLQAQDFYVEMKWEFTSWGKGAEGASPGFLPAQGFCTCGSAGVELCGHSSSRGSFSSFSSQLCATSLARLFHAASDAVWVPSLLLPSLCNESLICLLLSLLAGR